MRFSKQAVFRSYRYGFFIVVGVLSTVAAYTLWSEVRANARIQSLVSASLRREQLIGLIRLDAALLERAVEDHINSTDATGHAAADEAIGENMREINSTSTEYAQLVPDFERDLWKEFEATTELLVKTAMNTVNYSSRRKEELARKQLAEEVRPIVNKHDELADRIGHDNAEQTKELLRSVERIRLRETVAGSVLLALAVMLSVVVAVQVSRLLRRQEETISSQLAELNRRNAELDAFASRVAHDLVSPLAPLRGYLTLARRATHEREVQELLAHAEKGTSRVSELVDALLKFCRSGNASDQGEGQLSDAVNTILLEASQNAEQHQVELQRAIEENVVVRCPPQLLQSIAQNLVSNAIKYTAGREVAQVKVEVKSRDGLGILEVADTGRGMGDETLAMLFQPFFRAPQSKGVPGYGLGLATTKRLVEAHGGLIKVQSSLEHGTTVTVELPLAGVVAEPVPKVSAEA